MAPQINLDRYYMDIARAVTARSNCKGRRVGAVVVRENRIVSTGYNGTPQGVTNCNDGGCARCDPASGVESGTFYDLCLCVHAEENALLSAVRLGSGGLDGATIYTTVKPCFSCMRQLIQAGIKRVCYRDDWRNPKAEQLKWLYGAYDSLTLVLPLTQIPDLQEADPPRKIAPLLIGASVALAPLIFGSLTWVGRGRR